MDRSSSLELLYDRQAETLVWPGRLPLGYLGPGLLSSLEGPRDPEVSLLVWLLWWKV